MGVLSALLTVVCVIIYKKIEPNTKIRVMTAIPVVGTFFLMLKTRDFASELGGLLTVGTFDAKCARCFNRSTIGCRTK